ncbi:MAG TPA: hypothetical protein VFA59_19625 [Vicinamibacterales bacterium]|nr:hypothetical protein [Vicinamibacterales bacterium]
MRIKVHRGTPANDGDSLCYTCRFSRLIRGRTLDEEIVVCDASHMTQMRVTFKVTSCTDYSDNRVPSYGELVQQAWILHPGSRKRRAGFVRGSELRADEFADVMTDPRDRDR